MGRSNQQQNTTSVENTRGEYFSYFGTIRANPFEEFEAFRKNNNNNPFSGNNNGNNSPLLSLLLKFRGGLERRCHQPLSKELNPNIAALVNALTEANLRINHAKRELNHVKLTVFRRIEVKNLNK